MMNQQHTPSKTSTTQPETPIEKPIPPEAWECCNSECGELCVYAIYRTQKQAYDAQQKRLANQSNNGIG